MAGELRHLHELPALAGIGLQFAYGLYALIALLSFVFVRKAVRETKGRELEDMDEDAPAAAR